jgi:hypothetical protein
MELRNSNSILGFGWTGSRPGAQRAGLMVSGRRFACRGFSGVGFSGERGSTGGCMAVLANNVAGRRDRGRLATGWGDGDVARPVGLVKLKAVDFPSQSEHFCTEQPDAGSPCVGAYSLACGVDAHSHTDRS